MPELVPGCVPIADRAPAALDRLLATALELGMNFFDHANICPSLMPVFAARP